MSGPLTGLRVIDCSSGTAGPRATGVLADYGADVIWVEPPGGDPRREELAIPYSAYNRGKRSTVFDLEDESQRDTLLDLLESADVFVESWEPGGGARLSLDYDAVHRRIPSLVYCSLSGFGLDGPHRDVPPYEALVHALVGTMGEQVGHRDGPIFEGLPFASIGAAYLALIGVLGALYRRSLDGAGRHVETSLLDGALAYLSMMWGDKDKGEPRHAPGASRLIARSFRCADDEYLGVHTGAVGAFGRLMQVLGLDDRIPPSETGMDIGVPLPPEQKDVLDAEIDGIFESQPRSVWLERLLDADICAIPHLRPGEVFDEAQPIHNEMIVEVDDPVLGPVQQVAPPAKFAATPGAVGGPAPTPGQHTEEILLELRGNRPRRNRIETRPIANRLLLDGIRILDFGAYYAGPYSSRLLADLGADVIKVEPILGDQLRGIAVVFRSAQAGKRSLALNLKDSDAQPVVRKLVEWADILHHNLRPGAAERLGLGYEQVRAIKRDIIYLYAPGWSSNGPDMNRQSFAPLLSGYVGAGFETAGELNPPLYPVGNEDPGNGLLGAVGMLMSLLHRQRTGEGQLVENPQLNATMAHMMHVVRRPDGTVLGAGRLDPLQLGIAPLHRLYETSDGWLCVVAELDQQIKALGQVLELDLLGDGRFATRAARDAHAYELSSTLAEIFGRQTTAKWLLELRAAGVPAAAPVPHNNIAFMNDPENRRTGRVAECPIDKLGHVRELAVLVRVSDTKVPPHRIAPELGEHTDEILSWLGYEKEKIAELRSRNVVR